MHRFRLLSTLLATACTWAVAGAQTFVGTAPSNKNVVLEEYTGVNCGYCPDGHRIAQQIYSANPGRVVLLNIHTGGYATPSAAQPEFRTAWGNAMRTGFSVTAFPNGSVNRRDYGNGWVEGRSNWASRATTVLGEASPVNVAARCSLDVTTRQMVVDVEVYYTANGPGTTNKLHVMLTQNNVAGAQSGASYNPSAVLPDGRYNHQHAFRHNFTPTWGDVIDSVSAGTFRSFRYTYTLPADFHYSTTSGGWVVPAELGELDVVAYISESNTNILTGNEAQMNIYASATNSAQAQTLASTDVAFGSVCGSEITADIRIENTGSQSINNIEVSYDVNGTTQTETINFATPLAMGQSGSVSFSIPGLTQASNNISLSVSQVNGQANANPISKSMTVDAAQLLISEPDSLLLDIRFDNYPEESTYSLYDETAGQAVFTGTGQGAADGSTRQVSAVLVDGHCYTFTFNDAAGDGIWSSQYGMGAFYLSLAGNRILVDSTFSSKAGMRFTYQRFPTAVSQQAQNIDALQLFPNPASSQLNLKMELSQAADTRIEILNLMGQQLQVQELGQLQAGSQQVSFAVGDLPAGSYFLVVRQNGVMRTERFNIVK